MALQTSPHPHVHAHASHASHAHAAHAASKAKVSLSADDGEGEGGGFAAQLLKAQPAADADLHAADAKSPTAEPAAKARKSDGDKDGADAKDAQDGQAKDGGKSAAEAQATVDPAALLAAQQQQQPPLAPPTTSLAGRKHAGGREDAGDDPLGALRKVVGQFGQDDGRQALLASLAAGDAGQDASHLGKDDIAVALARADEAVKAAVEARDALAAMLPQPDPVAVQAGAIGAPANAVLDPSQGLPTPPALPVQVTLPMPPSSPAFMPALGQQIDVWMKNGVQHAEVQLNPQDLGPIRVRIAMEGAQTRVQMAADVQSTRDALQQAMPQLSEQLGQVGISLTGGGVSDQPAFQQASAQAGGDGFGRPGAGTRAGGDPGDPGRRDEGDLAVAAAARRPVSLRGLLDTYA